MATWEDGPEYAPRQRPGHFDPPLTAPLELAGEPVSAVPDAGQVPATRPGYGQPDAPPLELLGIPVEDGRDPQQPYRMINLALTPFGEAPRRAASDPTDQAPPDEPAVAAFDPTQPMTDVSGPPGSLAFPPPQGAPAFPPPGEASSAGARPASPFPQPGTPAWFGPSSGPPEQRPAPDFGAVVRAITPAVLIFLILAGLFQPLSLPLFVVAMFCSVRIVRRKRAVRNLFLGGLGTGLILSLLVLALGSRSFSGWWSDMSWLMLVISWVVLITCGFIQSRALQMGETTDQA